MTVSVIIPCRNGVDSITATVEAVKDHPSVSEVIVVDDGSKDMTATTAYNAGARVVRLERNQGKAAAMIAGVEAAAKSASIFLFVDADTKESAAGALHLLPPVLRDEADMTIAILPSAGGKGGFGIVRDFARWGIYKGSRARVKAPLSGQRAIKAPLMHSLIEQGLAPRFGVEVGLTIDALNQDARVAEVQVNMTHDHKGRGASGFLHRGNQGKDVVRALWYRALPLYIRVLPTVIVTAILIALCGLAAAHNQSGRGTALPTEADVGVVLVPGATWDTPGVSDASGPRGSIVTGTVDDVIAAVEGGTRSKHPVALLTNVTTGTEFPTSVDRPTLVVGVTVKGDKGALRPIVLEGTNASGTLTSPSTHRDGLVDLTDIAPTVLAMRGDSLPEEITGTPIHVIDKQTSIDELSGNDEMARFYDRINPTVIVVFVFFQIFAYFTALYLARSNKELAGARWVALAVAGFPLATFLARWTLNTQVTTPGLWTLVVGAFLAAIVYIANSKAPLATTALRRILGVTIVFISVDVVLGSHLQLSGTFGSSPTLGARYHGIGNPASELMLLAAMLWVGLHVQGSQRRADALWTSTSLLIVTTIVVGAPGLGSDVGGLFAMVITSLGLLSALHLRRLPLKWLGGGVFMAIAVLVATAYVDYRRAPDDRTHLGRLMARVINEGPSPLIDTIGRKIDANVLAYGFPWSLGVVAIVAFMLCELARGRWNSALPLRSAQRIALVAALAGSFVGYAVNDSGIVVLALVAVFVGPFVLVEYRHRRGSVELTNSKLEVVSP